MARLTRIFDNVGDEGLANAYIQQTSFRTQMREWRQDISESYHASRTNHGRLVSTLLSSADIFGYPRLLVEYGLSVGINAVYKKVIAPFLKLDDEE